MSAWEVTQKTPSKGKVTAKIEPTRSVIKAARSRNVRGFSCFFFTSVPLVCTWIHVSECGLFVLKSLSSLSKAVSWLHSVFCWKDAFSNVNVILPCGSCKEWHNSVCACMSSTHLHRKRAIDGWEGWLRDFYWVVPHPFISRTSVCTQPWMNSSVQLQEQSRTTQSWQKQVGRM